MNRKTIIISLVALFALSLFVVASAVTVFALVGGSPAEVEQAIELEPVQIEQVAQPQVVEPVLHSESVGYSGKTGCPYQEAKMQQVHAEPVDEIEDNLLTQVVR